MVTTDYMEALRVQLSALQWISGLPGFAAPALAAGARVASPVFVAPWVVQSVSDAAAGVPEDVTLEDRDLPVASGFALAADPSVFTMYVKQSNDEVSYAGPFEVVWILWHTTIVPDRLFPAIPRGARGVLVQMHGTGPQIGPEADDLLHNAIWFWPFGDNPDGFALPTTEARLAYALWAFMRERRITSVTRRGIDRPLRRQAERSGWTQEPIIQVIELRAQEARHVAPPDGVRAPVEWTCRWAVRGHWRRRISAGGGVVAVPVMPHMKGPKDKPLRNATKLLAVVR